VPRPDPAARSDFAVVGAGIVGLATALALADRGETVTVYERARPGGGQSGGQTRVFRHLHDDPRLTALAVTSRALWRAWQERFDRELIGDDGVVIAGPDVAGGFDALRDAGVPASLLEPKEQSPRLPYLRPFAGPVLFEQTGGPIRVRAAIECLTGHLGERVVRDEVLAVSSGGTGAGAAGAGAGADGAGAHAGAGTEATTGTSATAGVEVLTPGGARRHGRVVVCAGADTAGLAAACGLKLPVRESLHVRLTYPVRADPPPPAVACLLDGSGEHGGEHVYATPLPGNRHYAVGLRGEDGLIDLGGAADDERATAVARWRRSLHERLAAYVARALPALEPTAAAETVCRVTRLPGDGDAFAAWPAGDALFFAGNNLFKHAPALGELLARAVCEGAVPAEMKPATRPA